MILFLFLFPLFSICEGEYNSDDRIPLCANLTLATGGSYYSNFYPKIGKLAMLRVPLKLQSDENKREGESESENIDIRGATISFMSESGRTPNYQLTSDDNKTVVEFLSLVLFFDKGVNNGINWDTSFDTNSCKNRKYIGKTCAQDYDQDNYAFLKVFTAAVGTDKKKTPLTSADSLPSTFVKFGAGGVIDDATDFVKKAGDWFKNTF